jgi:hypothetical protein
MVRVAKFKLSSAPKRVRTSVSKFESMAEWPVVKRAIDRGIPAGDGISVEISKADRESRGIDHMRTIPRFIAKYIAKEGHPYTVGVQNRGDIDVVLIKHPRR